MLLSNPEHPQAVRFPITLESSSLHGAAVPLKLTLVPAPCIIHQQPEGVPGDDEELLMLVEGWVCLGASIDARLSSGQEPLCCGLVVRWWESWGGEICLGT